LVNKLENTEENDEDMSMSTMAGKENKYGNELTF
jgi:hypothetical protein